MAEWDRKIKNMERATRAVEAARKKTGATNGVVPCPNCGTGWLTWKVAGPRAWRVSCSTPDCTEFMS